MFLSILLLCVSILAAIFLSPASMAYAALIDPNISQWGGGGGGSSQKNNKIFVNDYFAEYGPDCFNLEETTSFRDDNDQYQLLTYSFVSKNVSQYPSTSTSYNTIDHVIFMVSQLEIIATHYLQDHQQEPSQNKIKNLVLGYIRGINKEYYDNGYSGKWKLVAGKIDTDFITYVHNNDLSGTGVSILEFFASFLQEPATFNSTEYGNVGSSFLNKRYTLSDPLDSGQTLDLLHFFAAMDGIMELTEQDFTASLYAHHLQRPVASWLGDLLSMARELKEKNNNSSFGLPLYTPSNGHIDFNSFVGCGVTSFSSSDLLADIDAYNLTKYFIDNPYNKLSKSLAAYYRETATDNDSNGNRYDQFIFTSVLEKTKYTNLANTKSGFRQNVHYFMNLSIQNGTCTQYSYYMSELGFGSGGIFSSLLDDGLSASTEVRAYCAGLFCDYLISMSRRV